MSNFNWTEKNGTDDFTHFTTKISKIKCSPTLQIPLALILSQLWVTNFITPALATMTTQG